MPLAHFKLGVGPLGQDPAASSSARALPALPAAFAYDVATRSYPLNTDGTSKSMDPVVARVALIMSLRKGSFRGDPTLGVDWVKIKNAPQGSTQRVCDVEVRRALDDLVAAGDITITSVTIDDSRSGRLFWELIFVNLRDLNNPVLPLKGSQ